MSSEHEFGNASRVIRILAVDDTSSAMAALLSELAAKHPEWPADAAKVYVVGRDGRHADARFLSAPLDVVEEGNNVVGVDTSFSRR